MRLLIPLLVAMLGAASAAEAQNSPAAQRVIDRARAATGGSGWNRLRGLHEVGEVGGLSYQRWIDPVRYGDRTDTKTPGGLTIQAYNGAGEWRRLANGILTGSVEREVLAEVRADAFFGAYAYFFPSRFDLRSVLLGQRQSEGRTYDVLRVQPAGGEPRELWFDQRTGMLGIMVDETGPRQGRFEFSDYRRVGPVQLPFRIVAHGGGRAQPQERKVEKITLPVADRSLFSLPPPKD